MVGLNKIVSIYLAIIIFGFLLGYLQTYLMQLTGQEIMYDLRVQIFTHLRELPLAFYDKNPVGRLMIESRRMSMSSTNSLHLELSPCWECVGFAWDPGHHLLVEC